MGKAAYLNTARWQRTRFEVFTRDGWRCARCGKASRLECHHISPLWKDRRQDPYDSSGCLTLCRGCHIEETRNERKRAQPITPYTALINKLIDD